MFPLARYFSIASLAALALVTVIVLALSRNVAVDQMVAAGEVYNVELANSFANSIWPQFGPFVLSAAGINGDTLRAQPETAALRKRLEALTRGLPVLKVKIYDIRGLTVFSSQESQIGEDKSNNRGFFSTATEGKPATAFSRRGTFSAFSGEVYDRAIVESYVPIRREGRTVGIFEIYTDATPLMTRLDQAQLRLLGILMAVFGALYLALFLIVRRADGILKQQYGELLERERALQRETERAQRADRAKSEFLANMSHELRTPMTAILGFAEALTRQASPLVDGERQLQAVKTIRRNGEHLLEIVNGILDLSRIEAGGFELELAPFSPAELVEDVVSLMEVQAAERGLRLEFEVDSSTPVAVESDATRIRQILINLIGNGLRFTEAGRVRVAVRYLQHSANPCLEFQVIDTGSGLAPDHLERIFDPFVQAGARLTASGGTGLGLTICKRLTDLLGGVLEVASVPGEGSTFTVRIPAPEIEAEQLSRHQEPASPRDPSPRRPSLQRAPQMTGRILLAEDNPDNRTLIAEMLRDAGAELELADNGQTALTRVLEAEGMGKGFDVVLLDMEMPVMDGYDCAGKLRAAGFGGAIVALTAHAMPGDRRRCIESGCDDYAPKPVNRSQLIRLVGRYARSSAAARKSQGPQRPSV